MALLPCGSVLNLRPDPQDVFRTDFGQIVSGVVAPEELLQERRIAGNVPEIGRKRVTDAVKIRAQSDMVYAGQRDNVIDMIGHIGDRRPGEGVLQSRS